METINHYLTIGTPSQGMDLFCNLSIDGRHLLRMHSESFIGNFLRDVHGMMHQGRTTRLISHNEQYIPDDTIPSVSIAGGEVEIYKQYGFYCFNGAPDPAANPVCLHIWGCQSLPELNGTWRVASTSGSYSGHPTNVRLQGAPATMPVADYVADDASVISKYWGKVSVQHSYYGPFRKVYPTVGAGANPVSITDVGLHQPIDALLSRGAVSVSPVVTDQQKSVFTISAPFTNATGGDLTIREMGLATYMSTARYDLKTVGTLYARDVLPAAVNLPTAKTLTLDYECRFELENFNQDTALYGTNGGFLATFAEALRRQATETTNRNWAWMLLCILGGGTSMGAINNNAAQDGYQAWKLGLRLGESSKFVSMTDADLSPDATQETPYVLGGIVHGSGDGQLVHHGMLIDDDVTIDGATNEAHFNIARVFENRGATDITVKEIGLYAKNDDDYNTFIPTLVARRALAPADQFTIAAGQMRKVNYKIKMTA